MLRATEAYFLNIAQFADLLHFRNVFWPLDCERSFEGVRLIHLVLEKVFACHSFFQVEAFIEVWHKHSWLVFHFFYFFLKI